MSLTSQMHTLETNGFYDPGSISTFPTRIHLTGTEEPRCRQLPRPVNTRSRTFCIAITLLAGTCLSGDFLAARPRQEASPGPCVLEGKLASLAEAAWTTYEKSDRYAAARHAGTAN